MIPASRAPRGTPLLEGTDAHRQMGPGGAGGASGLAMVVEDGGQVAGGDAGPAAHGDGALDGGLELADVARPVVPLQDVEGIAGEARDVLVEFLRVTVAERLGQELDVGPPVPQGRRREHDHADPMIELLAEPPLFDQGRQALAGGQDESDLPAGRRIAGGSPVVAELQVAEQVEL